MSGGAWRIRIPVLVGGLLALGAAGRAGRIPIAPEASLPVLDPNGTAFPAANLVDFSSTLDGPAGKRGFVFAGTDGHLYFEDGARARFWGINVAKDAVFVPHEVIDEVASVFAAAGFNLVRLHHVDGVTGLLPPERAGTGDRIDPDKLDALFYWVHALKQRGVYAYLDLLDFRTFQEAEGVAEAEALGRGAKPAAVFSERLIELQIAYARDLLFTRVNPYTKLALGEDPAVAMVEICDENGLFARAGKWGEMPKPYVAELQRRWNFWLRAAYGTSDSLRQAWQGADGRSALGIDERIEDSSVRLHPPTRADLNFPSPTGAPRLGRLTPARGRDVARFCHSVHREYFAGMKRALREAGLRAPLTAVTRWEHPADLRAVAEELDFVGCNWYYDHPVFAAGRAWRLPSFFTNTNPIADQQGLDFTASALRAGVEGKPLVIREWGACWPSKFRGVGLIEATAYAALQDIDALILFTYNTKPDVRRIEYFDVSSDPVRWGLVGLAGHLFRTRAIEPARDRVAIGHSREDSFAPGAALPPELMRLGWRSRVRQVLYEDIAPGEGFDRLIPFGARDAGLPAAGEILSDTGQIHRLVDEERLLVDAPRVQAVAGALSTDPVRTSVMVVSTPSPIGVVAAVSLTEQPLAETEAMLVRMVTVAANEGEKKSPRRAPPQSPQVKLEAFGGAPVHTRGEPDERPTAIDLADAPLLSVYSKNGTWEAVRKGSVWYVWSDTPHIRVSIPALGPDVGVTPFTQEGSGEAVTGAQPFEYPAGCLFVRVEAAGS